MKWRMAEPCMNCPFNADGPGLKLRRSLHKARWRSIRMGLLHGEHFTCHKTSDETGDGSNLMCAGAISFQQTHNVSSNLQRIMERLDSLHRKPASAPLSAPGARSGGA